MGIINHMMKVIDTDVSNLKQGLQPQNLSFWYEKIIKETIEMAPPWLQDKIKVHQDPILTMKFNLEILLTEVISKEFPNSSFQISKLDNDFGPAVLEKEVEALVVSDETSNQGIVLNQLRAEKKMPPVKIITVPMFLAKDGIRISTTRIKNSEIDTEGNLLSID